MSYTCHLSQEMLDKAKEELHEDGFTRLGEIQSLKEKLLKYPGLNPRVDDAFLLRFLRSRKFDQRRTLDLLIHYYETKKENEDLYATMTPKSIQHMLAAGTICVLPNRGKQGETIVILKPGRWDPDKYPIIDIYKTVFMVLSYIVESEETQVNGVRVINDLGDLTWNHARNFSPSLAKKVSNLLQDVMPMRLKGIHYVHQPTFFDLMFKLMKQFMREKMANRIHLHGENVKEIHEYVDVKHLPVEYAGELETLDYEVFMETLLSKESEFEAEAKFGFVSMVMEDTCEKSSNVTGMAGTFKKLSID